MGKKGKKSQRGIGEIDAEVRDKSLFFKVTRKDYLLLSIAAKKENITKVGVLVQLIRKHLSKYAKYITSPEGEKLD